MNGKLFGALFLWMLHCTEGASADRPHAIDKPISIAVVEAGSGGDRSALLENLLIEKLSRLENIRLVERTEIDRIVGERNLTAQSSVDSDLVLQLSQLLGAKAIVLLSVDTKDVSAPCRVLLTETYAGMRLLDYLVDMADVEGAVQEVMPLLAAHIRHADQPVSSRQYIGMMGFHSEAPGRMLGEIPGTLATLVEGALSQAPEFIVLERAYLNRLREERELSGIDQAIRNSSLIIEAGVQLVGRNDLEVTLHLLSMSDGASRYLTVKGSKDALATLKDDIIVAIRTATRMGVVISGAGVESVSAEDRNRAEALAFSKRAKWMRDHGFVDRVAEFAEASLALSFSMDAAILARDSYAETGRWRVGSGQILQQILRANELDLQVIRHLVQQDLPFSGYRDNGLLIPRPPDGYVEEGIVDQIRSMMTQKYQLLMGHYGNDLTALHDIVGAHIKSAGFLARSPKDFDRQVKNDVELFVPRISRIDRVHARRASSYRYYWALQGLVAPWSDGGCRISLFEWMTKSSDLETKMFGYLGLAHFGQDSVRDRALKGIVDSATGEFIRFDLREAIRAMDDSGEYFAYLLSRARETAEVGYLTERAQLVRELVNDVSRRDMSRDCLAMVDDARRMIDGYNRNSRADIKLSEWLHVHGNSLRQRKEIEIRGPGPWDRFDIVPIDIGNQHGYGRIIWVHTQKEKIQTRPDEAIIVRQLGSGKTVFSKLDVHSGQLATIGVYEGDPPLTFMTTSAGSSERYFMGCAQGLLVVADGNVKLYESPKDLPVTHVSIMAQLNGKLYLADDGSNYQGDRGALVEYDPGTGMFRVVASGRSLNPRNALDGGNYYRIVDMASDNESQCLWISISHDADRRGLWRFTPATDEYERVSEFQATQLQWNGDRLILFSSWKVYEYSSSSIHALGSYPNLKSDISKNYSYVDGLYFQGLRLYDFDRRENHIIQDKHVGSWQFVRRCGPGAIVADLMSLRLLKRKANGIQGGEM